MEDIEDRLYLYLKGRFHRPDGQIYATREGLISMIADGVRFLEKCRLIDGHAKKIILIRTLKIIIEDTHLPYYSRDLLHEVIDNLGETIIDNLVKFGKDKSIFRDRKLCTLL